LHIIAFFIANNVHFDLKGLVFRQKSKIYLFFAVKTLFLCYNMIDSISEWSE